MAAQNPITNIITPDGTTHDIEAQYDSDGNEISSTYVKIGSDVTGNAATATALKTSRTISLTGDTTGSASFNGSANASIATTTSSLKNTGDRPTSANILHGDGKIYYYIASSSMTEGKPPHDAQIIHLSWDNTGGYDSQLAVANTAGTVYVRTQSAGTWTSWNTLASQTWVTGTATAAKAAKLSTSRTIKVSDATATNTGSGVTFDGSADVTLKLPSTIKADLSGNADTATKATQDGNGNNIVSTYETKAEATAKHDAIDEAIAGITSFEYEVVTALPSTGTKGKIYLIADTHSDSNDTYDEYMWIDSAFEKIGNTDANLSQYGQTLSVDGQTLSLKNGTNTLSSVTTQDTMNTVGASDASGIKLYLVGVKDVSTKAMESFTNGKAYIGADNCLYSGGVKVMVQGDNAATATTATKANQIVIDGTAYTASFDSSTGALTFTAV